MRTTVPYAESGHGAGRKEKQNAPDNREKYGDSGISLFAIINAPSADLPEDLYKR
jgi:hypothetical protein